MPENVCPFPRGWVHFSFRLKIPDRFDHSWVRNPETDPPMHSDLASPTAPTPKMEAEEPTKGRKEAGTRVGDLERGDVEILSMECVLMCTELGAGLTSYGQAESDREGLQTCRIQADLTKRGFKSMLYFLDMPSSSAADELGPARETGCEPWSLEYRLCLLGVAREANYPTYDIYGRKIPFSEWRRAQIRLVLSLVESCLGGEKRKIDKGGEGGSGVKELWLKDLCAPLPSSTVFAVRDDSREYTRLQLMSSIHTLALGLDRMQAPNPQLWSVYCETVYARMLVRFQNQVNPPHSCATTIVFHSCDDPCLVCVVLVSASSRAYTLNP